MGRKQMKSYILAIYDINDIFNKKLLKELEIEATDKGSAQEKGHSLAKELFPDKKIVINIRG